MHDQHTAVSVLHDALGRVVILVKDGSLQGSAHQTSNRVTNLVNQAFHVFCGDRQKSLRFRTIIVHQLLPQMLLNFSVLFAVVLSDGYSRVKLNQVPIDIIILLVQSLFDVVYPVRLVA
jgi:hypothetical protein